MYKNVDTAFKSSLTAISIGPGILGIERGVERIARLTHLAYVEIEAFIIENLVAQMEHGVLAPAVIWSDCKTLPCEPFRGLVDILFAGYPCQPFSTAGKRRGTEDPRHLFPYIERAIRIIRPRACFFENVRGHVTCGLPEVVAALEGLGYRVHWGIYSAEETGAAHKRERVFILALANTKGAGIWGRLRNIHKADGRPYGELSLFLNSAGKELENPTGIGCRSLRPESTGLERGTIINDAGDELADSKGISEREQNNKNSTEPWEDSWESTGRGGSQLADSNCKWQSQSEGYIGEGGEWFGNGGESVSHTERQGLEERAEQSTWEEQPAAKRGRIVARPGEPQPPWEHPRVISREVESYVGLSAHGYHFREDVLRALGNSVYADTAEVAFKDLIRKHGILI